MRWQPIETAPKNEAVLLYVDIVIGDPLVIQGYWFSYDGESGWVDHNGDLCECSHWMPLPKPPEEA